MPARTHAVEYDHWFEEPWGRYAFGVEYRTLFHAAGPLDGTRVLDAGCGTGRFALAAPAQGAWVVGIDPDPAMLDPATPRLARHCVRGVIEGRPGRWRRPLRRRQAS
jgi:SAM-dependent methyltransferase